MSGNFIFIHLLADTLSFLKLIIHFTFHSSTSPLSSTPSYRSSPYCALLFSSENGIPLPNQTHEVTAGPSKSSPTEGSQDRLVRKIGSTDWQKIQEQPVIQLFGAPR